MASANDLNIHAVSSTDFYALLSLPPTFTPRELERAKRQTALKYHPDKVGPQHTDTFHLVQIGYEILHDEKLKSLYDSTRAARARKQAQEAQLDGKRRAMKDALERRERGEGGVKRTAYEVEEEDDEAKLEREIRRLAEQGRKRRMEMQEALRKEAEERAAADSAAAADAKAEEGTQAEPTRPDGAISGVSEMERMVKVRFLRNADTDSLKEERLAELFSTFGPVESTLFLPDKMVRIGESRAKQMAGRGSVTFRSVVGAHAAVTDWQKQRERDPIWQQFVEVDWASGEAPACIKAANPEAAAARNGATSKSDAPPSAAGGPPKFASFAGKGTGALSREEHIMMRLRHAQRRREELGILEREESIVAE